MPNVVLFAIRCIECMFAFEGAPQRNDRSKDANDQGLQGTNISGANSSQTSRRNKAHPAFVPELSRGAKGKEEILYFRYFNSPRRTTEKGDLGVDRTGRRRIFFDSLERAKAFPRLVLKGSGHAVLGR